MNHSINSSRHSIISHHDTEAADEAAKYAVSVAFKLIKQRIDQGEFKLPDQLKIVEQLYQSTYNQEYYKRYAQLKVSRPTIIYVTKYPHKKYDDGQYHTIFRFTKLNQILSSKPNRISIEKIYIPVEDEKFQETKDIFLKSWPGPLDQIEEKTARNVVNYIDDLLQHESQRKLRYISRDDQRKLILKLLIELLNRNGDIDGPSVTRLLLPNYNTEISFEEKRPYETLKKYLILGKRSEAIKYIKGQELWPHAQCLAFLDKFQPLNSFKYPFIGSSMVDDSFIDVQMKFIHTIADETLRDLYYSLLKKIFLYNDPESSKFIRNAQVGKDNNKFAILCANDCEMDFDQSNEIFKLIMNTKRAMMNPEIPTSHVISFGMVSDPRDESFSQYGSSLESRRLDPDAEKRLLAENLDNLILNEVWEYSLNLCRKTTDFQSYNYLLDLLPSKLILASKLLDYGFYGMFEKYLYSLTSTLNKALQSNYHMHGLYDLTAISSKIDYLNNIWATFYQSMHLQDFDRQQYNHQHHNNFNEEPQRSISNHQIASSLVNEDFNDTLNAPFSPINYYDGDYPPPHMLQQHQVQQQHQQQQHPHQQQQQHQRQHFNQLPPQQQPQQPLQQNFQPEEPQNPSPPLQPSELPSQIQQQPPPQQMFHQPPPPPMQQHQPLESLDSDESPEPLEQPHSFHQQSQQAPPPTPQQQQQQPQQQNQQQFNQPQQQQQQQGFLTNLIGSAKSIIPKSNSKPMILPDDKGKGIYYDEKQQRWVDPSDPSGGADGAYDEPPPMMPAAAPQTSYKFVETSKTYSTSRRYPKP